MAVANRWTGMTVHALSRVQVSAHYVHAQRMHVYCAAHGV